MKENGGNLGVSFCGLLQLVFIVLKLVGVIQWSWLFVLAPLWVPACAAGLLFPIFLFVAWIKDRR